MNKYLLSFFSWILIFLLFPSGAQNIPHLGSASDSIWSKSEEIAVGKAGYDILYRKGHIYQSQIDNDYLDYLGYKIGNYARTRLGLHFYITNSKVVNAFATPGGYVGVNAGLILLTSNEHELAAVLAHEIAHVSQEHIARNIVSTKNRQIANAAAIVAGILLATKNGYGNVGAAVVTAITAGERQAQINNIRRHEVEADNIGRKIMKKAGFDEKGMQSFFIKIESLNSSDNTPAYLLTHPLPIYRLAEIDNPSHQRGVKKKLNSSDEYYLFKSRIRASILKEQKLKDIISKDNINSSLQIKDSSLYLSALFFMKKAMFSKSIKQLSLMQTKMKNNRDVYILKAKLNLLLDNQQKARLIYKKLWKRFLGDNVVAYDYASFLMQTGDLLKSEKILANYANIGSLNSQLSFLYGQVLGKLGKTVEQNHLLIKYYQQIGEYKKALSQTQVASRLPNISWQDKSMFKAKGKELEKIILSLSI